MAAAFPDWNDLRDILLITEAGTLSAAARAAGVSQSTMSRRLAAIEATGQPVFLRDESGRMTPNARGRELVVAAREMQSVYEKLRQRLTDAPPPVTWLHAQRAGRAPHFKPGHGTFAVTHQEAREALALNYGNISCIDDAVGQVMAELARLGLADNTVVMFTSDHGDLLGDRGLMFKGGLH
mgnify:CR=1 FL=1